MEEPLVDLNIKNLTTSWKILKKERQSGHSKGQIDKYWISPSNFRFRSRVEVQSYSHHLSANLGDEIKAFESWKSHKDMSKRSKSLPICVNQKSLSTTSESCPPCVSDPKNKQEPSKSSISLSSSNIPTENIQTSPLSTKLGSLIASNVLATDTSSNVNTERPSSKSLSDNSVVSEHGKI